MSNIAVLIGISSYRSQSSLPACTQDVENMRALLYATNKYDEILCITQKTDAAQVKDELRGFFGKYNGNGAVKEAFIYFSGHGVYQNDAMLCCSDFDVTRPATTSISNSELDDLLRSVSPAVAVKVIDACQSGSPYIKDASAGFEKALGGSKLASFICMASSRQDQSSYASSSESFFTSSWIAAALSKSDGNVFYRDIQAYLADAFNANTDQTPYFVNQGTGLEIFSAVTTEMQSLFQSRSKSTGVHISNSDTKNAIALAVAEQDRRFVGHEQALNAIEQVKKTLEKSDINDPVVKDFYKRTSFSEGKLSSIPKSSSVASFASEQSWSKKFFVKINTEAYQTKVLKDSLGIMGAVDVRKMFAKRDESDYVTETRTRPASIDATEFLPLEVAEITYTSSHASLSVFQLYIALVHSLTDVMVISSTVRLAQKGWTRRAPELGEVQWRFESYPWAQVVKEPEVIWQDSLARCEADIRSYLESFVPRRDSVESTETSDSVASNKKLHASAPDQRLQNDDASAKAQSKQKIEKG